jgi:riboflavin kinase/FMN adenylyltransferase
MPQFFQNYQSLTAEHQRVVCLGNFDGIHRGHQSVLEACLQRAKQENARSLAFSFDPHPRRFFGTDLNLQLLMTVEEKKEFLSGMGFDEILVQNFDQYFSQMQAVDFVKMLEEKLRAKVVFFGRDFQFGRKAKGDAKTFADHSNIEVQQLEDFHWNSETVSSGAIRLAVRSGNIEKANELLGYPFFLSGRVIQGDQLGRQLGFPTANLQSGRECLPASGVYITLSERLSSGEFWPSVSNLGFRPSLEGREFRIESHFMDRSVDVYGEDIRLYFLKRLRDEKAFSDLSELRLQIERDVTEARKFFPDTAAPTKFSTTKLAPAPFEECLGFIRKIRSH